MVENKIRVYSALTISEVLYHLKTVPSLKVLAGSTLVKKNTHKSKFILPSSCIFIGDIAELKEITRKERYIDIGSAVTLNQILEIGKNRIPQFLYEAVSSVGSHAIRNIATIGGNICNEDHKMSLYSPLLALDASLELRSHSETLHVPLSKFSTMPQGFFLTRIRIPLIDWFSSSYIRLGSPFSLDKNSASYTFLADSSKSNTLEDLRIAFAGESSFRSRELENLLIGTRLPLVEKDSIILLYKASELLDEEIEKQGAAKNDLLKSQFLNLLEQSLMELKHV